MKPPSFISPRLTLLWFSIGVFGTPLRAADISPGMARNDVFRARVVDSAAQDTGTLDLFRMRFEGVSGSSYDILGSTNLQTWFALGSRTVTNGSASFEEPILPEPQRFYRVAFGGSGDHTPPSWPVDAKMRVAVLDSVGVDIDLHLAQDDVGVAAYALYQNGAYVTTLAPNQLSAFVGGLTPNTVYEFDVVACDAGGNCTQAPATLNLRTRTAQEPFLNAAHHDGTFLSSGEFAIRRTDLDIPARELGFQFIRTYRSDRESAGPLGFGWTANVFESLRERSSGDVVWQQGDGRADTFVKQSANIYTAPPGFFMTLSKLPGGFLLVNATGTRREFDLAGRLLSRTTRNGNALTFLYSSNQLAAVSDDLGRATAFAYDAQGRIESLTDFTGRQVRYTYDAASNLVSVRSPTVTGAVNGNNFPDGKTEQYTYDTGNADPDLAHNLVGIIAPNEVANGSLTPCERLTYGAGGSLHDRVLTHTIGGTNDTGVPAGGTMTYAYTFDPNHPQRVLRTTITDRRAFNTHHDFNPAGHRIQKTEVLNDRPDPITAYTYDGEGNLLTVTHPEGNVTTYTYDSAHPSRRSQGNRLEATRTPGPRGAEQTELATRFTYEPIFNQLRTLTDSRGNTWSNHFDYAVHCNFEAIGARVGLSAAEAQALLEVGPDECDPYGDYLTNPVVAGNVIRAEWPRVSLFPGGHQAAAEGGTNQQIVELFAYNLFGQRVRHTDPEENVTTFVYNSSQDPDGDGVTNNPAGDPATGGYLRRRIQDTQAAPGRNSGVNSPPIARRHEFEYNPRGALVRATDPRGVVMEITRNDLDQPIRVRRAADIASGVVPDPAEPAALTALAYFQMLAYDANNNLIRHDEEDSGDTSNTGGLITTLHQYDILDRRLATTEEIDVATTRITRYRYCPDGNLALLVYPEGNAVARHYDERNLLVATHTGALAPPLEAQIEGPFNLNPRGGTPSITRLSWNDNGNLASATDAADTDGSPDNNGPGGGDVTTFAYDGYDRRIATVDPAGNRTTTSYDANGNRTRVQQFGPNGGLTPTNPVPSSNLLAQMEFRYDQVNRLVQMNRWLGAPGLPGADVAEGAASVGKGDLVPGDGAINRRLEYDRLGRRTAVTQDDGDTTTLSYDGAGRILRRTDPAGNEVQHAYDDNGNLIESRRRDVATGGPAPDEFFLTTRLYDSLNRPVAVVDNLGHTTRFEYDSRDNVVAVSDANGLAAGVSITRRAFPNTPTTVNALNAHGNLTRFTYDGRNRLTRTDRVLTANGLGSGTLSPTPDATQGGGDGLATTRTLFDGNNLVTARLDDNQFRTGYEYDNLNRLMRQSHGLCAGGVLAGYICDPATTNVFTYDPDNNLIQKTDEAGNVFTHTFDALNRKTLTEIARAPGVGGVTQQRFEYDGLGRRTASFDDHSHATVEFAYDSLSRVVREITKMPGIGSFTNDSAWRAENLRSGLAYPNGTRLSYGFDAEDRIAQIADTAGTVANYDYVGQRLLEERFPNGARNSHLNSYDGVGRLVHLESRDSNSNLVVGFDYTWNRKTSRLSENKLHDPANGESCTYDSLCRLVQFNRPHPAAAPLLQSSWRLDGSGNWREVDGATRNTTSFNEIGSVTPLVGPPVTLTSDSNGNLTSDPTAPAGQMSYQFDAFNRLISASVSAGPTLTYTYDASGRRLSENDGGSHHLAFLHDGNDVVADWDVTGAQLGTPGTAGVLREFVSSAVCNDGCPYVYYFSGNPRRPARMENAAGVQFNYHYDSLGSVAALTPATGPGAERVRYEAYGTPTVTQTGGLAPTGNPYLFTSQRRCFATGNYYYRARYYDPNLGRFLSRDPIGAWGDAGNHGNAYAYANNNPVNRTDPSGLSFPGVGERDEPPMFGDEFDFPTRPVGTNSPSGPTTSTNVQKKIAVEGDITAHEFGHYFLGLEQDYIASSEFFEHLPSIGGYRLADRVRTVSEVRGGGRRAGIWNFTTGDGEVAYQQAVKEVGYGHGDILIGERPGTAFTGAGGFETTPEYLGRFGYSLSDDFLNEALAAQGLPFDLCDGSVRLLRFTGENIGD